jgi:hypothetical protein
MTHTVLLPALCPPTLTILVKGKSLLAVLSRQLIEINITWDSLRVFDEQIMQVETSLQFIVLTSANGDICMLRGLSDIVIH